MNLQRNSFARLGVMIAGTRWLWACVAAVILSACGTAKVNLENQALIQVQPGSIIYEIDGRVVYSMFSAREQAVTPGEHAVLVTRFGDIRYDRGLYRMNVSAGLTYQIETNRRSVKVFDTKGAIIDELFLHPDDQQTFVSRAEYQRALQAQQEKRQAQLQAQMAQQAAMAEAERQRKLKILPLLRKIGTQICQDGYAEVGQSRLPIVQVGYVDAVTDDKIKIQISRAYFKNTPKMSPGGFQPSIIWDDPLNWDLCR